MPYPMKSDLPEALTAIAQWVCWRYEERDGKQTKVPYSLSGSRAAVDNPENWASFAQCRRAAITQKWAGIGLVLTEETGLVGIDLDKCVENGTLSEWAQSIVCRFDTYAEISPSGTGIRLWLRGKIPGKRRRAGQFEIYESGRYLTVTGNRLSNAPLSIAEGGEKLETLYREIFPEPEKPKARTVVSDIDYYLPEDALLEKAFSATNGSDVRALYMGDTSRHNGDHSAADMALVSHLAFYAGPNGQSVVDRLFRQSGLMRPKWDERHSGDGRTYGEMTLEGVYKSISEFYEEGGEIIDMEALRGQKKGTVTTAERTVTAKTGDFDAVSISKPELSPLSTLSPGNENQPLKWLPIQTIRENAMLPFPVEVLPDPIAAYAQNVAEVLRVPVDMPALSALAILSFAVCRRWDVEIHPSYTEPTNIYMAIAAAPGSRKSSTLEAMAFPLRHMEVELSLDGTEEAARMKERRAAEEARIRKKRDDLGKIEDAEARQKAADEVARMQEQVTPMPSAPRLLVEDVTPERLVGLLLEQAGTLALISSEGGVFGTMGGRYSDGQVNLDVYLKGHDAEAYRVDRLNRPAEFLPATRLAICVTVQPDVLQSLAAKREFRGRGLLGRFLYGVPCDLRGSRLMEVDDPGIRFDLRSAYGQAFSRLLRYPSKNSGNLFEHHHLAFSRDAREIHVEYANRIERRQGEEGDLRPFSDWASKLAGRVARIAACLHALEWREERPEAEKVQGETLLAAWAIADYLTEHAVRAFDMMSETNTSRHAQIIVDWLKKKRVETFTARECHRANQRQVSGAKAIEDGLKYLSLNNYIALTERKNGSGKIVQEWLVNPELYAQKPGVR